MKKPADQALVREMNLSMALRLIHQRAPISRAQLAQITGLNKSTASSLVDYLIERKLVHETGFNSAGAGRPATMVEINPNAGGVIGVEFGVDFVSVGLTNFVGDILWRKDEATDPADLQETTLNQTLAHVKEAMATARKKSLRLFGLGLATPGTVNVNEGVLIFAPNLNWHNVPFRKIFSAATKLNVFVENDANAAAIAEHLFGLAKHDTDFIFVFAGVGIGSGLFLNGKLYRGYNGYAGEIGHFPMPTDEAQQACHCGNFDCWEMRVNQRSIIARAQARIKSKRNSMTSVLMAKQNVPLSISIIKQAADAGDPDALAVFAETGRALGQGLAGLCNVFNPQKVIIGGPLSVVGNYLLPAVKEVSPRHSLPEIDQQTEIVLSNFGPDASLIGAIAIVVDEALSNPMNLERRR